MNNSIENIYSTSSPSFKGLDFTEYEIQEACNICYADHLNGARTLTSECFICGQFTDRVETKEIPFLNYFLVYSVLYFTIIFLAFFCFLLKKK